jgi:hypothetical protein
MMEEFTVSKYISLESLYKDQAYYYRILFERCMAQLVEAEEYRYNEEVNNYYNVHSGEYIDEGI